MKKPATMIYTLDDVPPWHVVVLNGIQHVGVIAINLVYPLLLLRLIDAPLPQITNALAIGMLVLGVATFLQAMRLGPVGSGYMLPATFTASYFPPSLLAAKLGGLPLVFGMTIFGGLLEMALAPLLHRLRAIFPSEISGLVIFMIGISAGIAGLRSVFNPQAVPLSGAEWAVAGATLAAMIVFNVWGKGIARMLCSLIGFGVGYVAAALAGLIDSERMSAVTQAPWIGFPDFTGLSYAFDVTLAAPFAIASVAVAMKAVGTITICQRMNDADWSRPDMKSIMRGVMADGLSTTISGLVGGLGTNTSTPSAGLAAATGVAARRVAYAAGAIFLVLGFLPKLPALLGIMPRSVIVASLMFVVAFIIINGLQVMTSRMLDARRTLVIALSIVAGVAVEVFPALAASAPKFAAPIIGSSLVFSTLIALTLNLVFRIGVRKTITIAFEPGSRDVTVVEEKMKRQGGIWGARADVITKACWAIDSVVDAVAENCWRSGPLAIEVSFDEFILDVKIAYEGELLEFSQQRPTEEEILNSEDGLRRLAGYLLRHIANKARSEMKDGKAVLSFRFDH